MILGVIRVWKSKIPIFLFFCLVCVMTVQSSVIHRKALVIFVTLCGCKQALSVQDQDSDSTEFTDEVLITTTTVQSQANTPFTRTIPHPVDGTTPLPSSGPFKKTTIFRGSPSKPVLTVDFADYDIDFAIIDLVREHLTDADQENYYMLEVRSVGSEKFTFINFPETSDFPIAYRKPHPCLAYEFRVWAVHADFENGTIVSDSVFLGVPIPKRFPRSMSNPLQLINVTYYRNRSLEFYGHRYSYHSVVAFVNVTLPVGYKPSRLNPTVSSMPDIMSTCPAASHWGRRRPTTTTHHFIPGTTIIELSFSPQDMRQGCPYAVFLEQLTDTICKWPGRDQFVGYRLPFEQAAAYTITLSCVSVNYSWMDEECGADDEQSRNPVCVAENFDYTVVHHESRYNKDLNFTIDEDDLPDKGNATVVLSWDGVRDSSSEEKRKRGAQEPLYYALRFGPGVPDDDSPFKMRFAQMLNVTDVLSTCPKHKQPAECQGLKVRQISIVNIPYGNYAVMICGVYSPKHELPPFNETDDPRRRQTLLVSVEPPVKTKKVNTMWLLATIAPLLSCSACVMLCAAFLIRRFRNKAKVVAFKMTQIKENYYIQWQAHDLWECGREQLQVYSEQMLGRGAFGVVYKGKLLTLARAHRDANSTVASIKKRFENCYVAVKQLPDYATEPDKEKFLSEIALMKRLAQDLGFHEHIVNPLACITNSLPYCLVIEYCSDGNLLDFLRDRRDYMLELQEKGIDYTQIDLPDNVDANRVLTASSLLQFAVNVSYAMEHIAAKGYVHRDLAARNVLIDQGRYAKVADFGMTKRVNDADPQYLDLKNHKVPIKWMAIESLERGEYSVKSDVWSFGVLLFEIMSFGGCPYPNINPHDVMIYLKSGYRMRPPEHCDADIYDLMLLCWHDDAAGRPSFHELRENLALKYSEITESYNYVPMIDANADYYTTSYPAVPLTTEQSSTISRTDSAVPSTSGSLASTTLGSSMLHTSSCSQLSSILRRKAPAIHRPPSGPTLEHESSEVEC